MLRRDIIPRKYFPPGYDYERETNITLFLFGTGTALSLQYYWKLYRAVDALYTHKNGKLLLSEYAMAPPFGHLVSSHWMFFAPFFLFLLAAMLHHYMYYCSAGNCLYLMRRLPKRGALFKSCVQAPLLSMGAGTVLLVFLHLIYYIIYLIMIPGECLP